MSDEITTAASKRKRLRVVGADVVVQLIVSAVWYAASLTGRGRNGEGCEEARDFIEFKGLGTGTRPGDVFFEASFRRK